VNNRREFLRQALTAGLWSAPARCARATRGASSSPGSPTRPIRSTRSRRRHSISRGQSQSSSCLEGRRPDRCSRCSCSSEGWRDNRGEALPRSDEPVLDSLRAAMPVDAVFLRLHGRCMPEGIGPAETVLVGEIRALLGPKIPIACTFDLHGNIPARWLSSVIFSSASKPLRTPTGPRRDRPDDPVGHARRESAPVSYVLPIR